MELTCHWSQSFSVSQILAMMQAIFTEVDTAIREAVVRGITKFRGSWATPLPLVYDNSITLADAQIAAGGHARAATDEELINMLDNWEPGPIATEPISPVAEEMAREDAPSVEGTL